MCGIAVPAGKRSDGLPMSVTLLAAAGKDCVTATLARDLHAASGPTLGATGWALPAPRAPPAGRTMRRSNCGGRRTSVRDAAQRRTPQPRRTILPGHENHAGLPAVRAGRPGRAETRPGSRHQWRRCAIEVEVWRLSPDAFGRFVARSRPARHRHDTARGRNRAQGFPCRTGGPDRSNRHFASRRLAQFSDRSEIAPAEGRTRGTFGRSRASLSRLGAEFSDGCITLCGLAPWSLTPPTAIPPAAVVTTHVISASHVAKDDRIVPDEVIRPRNYHADGS